MTKYIPLHVHTSYSLLDGGIKIEKLVAKAKACNMSAIAITDHGNMSGMVKLYKECKKHDIRPIVGTELYVDPNGMFHKDPLTYRSYHLILLAMNNEGLNNLIALNTAAHKDGFYYKPRIDWGILTEHHKGLICMSACVAGELPQYILQGESEQFWKTLGFYRSLFGDRFYLEIQNNTMIEQKQVNAVLKQVAREENIPLVMTTDAHYLDKEDAKIHDILLCIQTKSNVSQENRMRFPTDDFYIMTAEEMLGRAEDDQDKEAIANTAKIAERCCIELVLGENRMPQYDITKDKDYGQFIKEKENA
jgi:DNA polymerase-3 subunit alpha